jgi:hypothetical protein
VVAPGGAAGAAAREENAYTLGVQAVLWGYPMVCHARTSEASVRLGAARVNAFRRFTELKTAADRCSLTPNNVTIDAYGWLDLREGPVVLHVPTLTEPRWYLVQIDDTFDEVADNVGGLNGPRAGTYAITGPDFRGEVPGEMTRVRLRTTQAFAAARIFVAGQADLPGAVEAQRGFHLMPLSAYLRDGLRYEPPEGQTLPAFSDDAPAELRFFERLGQTMRWYLPISADGADPLVKAFHQIGLSAAHGFDSRSLDEDTARGLARAAEAAEQIIDARWAEVGETDNGWRYYTAGGRTGHDLVLRATLAKNVLGAQLASEVIYARCNVDAEGKPLHGQHAYQLHFPAGHTPPVSVFWNLAMYGEDMMFVENDLGRFSIGSTTDGLTANPDGSLTLYVQHDRPDDDIASANWLPAPDTAFNLAMRFYGPSTTVLDGSYRLPAVTKTT